MGLFRSSKHPQKDGKPPAPPSSNECPPALTRSPSSHHSISAKSSSAPHTRFQVFPDGTHAHYIKCPSSNRASLSLHNLAGIFHRDTGKPFKLSLFGDKKAAAAAAAGALQKERNAVDAELRRTPSSACLTEKWGTVNEVIGRGAFGVVRIAHKPNENGERLYAVKVRSLFVHFNDNGIIIIIVVYIYIHSFSLPLRTGGAEKKLGKHKALREATDGRVLHFLIASSTQRDQNPGSFTPQ